MKRTRLAAIVLAVLVALMAMLSVSGYRQAIAPPVQRSFHYSPADWPAGAAPVRIVFLSDLHIGSPDMPAWRFARVVDRINALRPDCVLIGGDFVTTKFGMAEPSVADVAAALAWLRPRLAVVAVRGNHDGAFGSPAAAAALTKAGVVLLHNSAARCGAVVVGGVAMSGNHRMELTDLAMRRFAGVRILLSHSPRIFRTIKGELGLTLVGHTHCGQIAVPLLGTIAGQPQFGGEPACGVIRRNGRYLLVTAGIGTTFVPIRWNVPPDFWLITIGPKRR